MKSKKTKILFIPVFLFLTSCFYDNQIYFDLENQSIKTCNKRVITRLYIVDEDYKEYFMFIIKKDKKGFNNFNLSKVSSDYSLETDYRIIDVDSFKLKKNMEYFIENTSNGDSACGILSIKTDKNGKVIWASKTSCK